MRIIKFQNGEIFSIAKIPAGERVLDLGIIDGARYYAVSPGIATPEYGTDMPVPLEPATAKRIWRQSPHCKMLQAALMTDVIRARYSVEEEMQAIREEDEEYQDIIARCNEQLAAARTELGL